MADNKKTDLEKTLDILVVMAESDPSLFGRVVRAVLGETHYCNFCNYKTRAFLGGLTMPEAKLVTEAFLTKKKNRGPK